MCFRVIAASLAVLLVTLANDVSGQTGQSVLLTANAFSAPDLPGCEGESKTSNVGGTITAFDSCDVQSWGSFLAAASASGNQSGNSLIAAASMEAFCPQFFAGTPCGTRGEAEASVAFSDTLTITSSGSFALRVVFSAATTANDCDAFRPRPINAKIEVSATGFGSELVELVEANPCLSGLPSTVNSDHRFAPIALAAGQTITLGYSIIAQAHGYPALATGRFARGSADASHTLYVIFEPVTAGAAFTSMSGIDYTRTPESSAFRYQFSGFGEPVSMDTTNRAQAGRTIPMLWRLTDLTGAPVSDSSSFDGAFSFQTACDGAAPADPVEANTSGASSLQYLGDGYWQFNWKTEKAYAKTCRRFYLKFSDGQMSAQAKFQFK